MVKASTQFKRQHKADYGKERLEVLYEDDDIVIVNKPSGLLSVPYPGSRVRTAQSILEDIMRKKGSLNNSHKPLTVHRLDRDTSGVLMFALNERTQKIVMDSWHQMVTERLYVAVAENPDFFQKRKFQDGDFKALKNEGLIDLPLTFNSHNVGFVPKKEFLENAKESHKKVETVNARTNYKILVRGATHMLFQLSLDTGKKNQIRAHLASQGYPLAGDENFRAKTDPFSRLALHARTLEFVHPYTQEKMKFEVPEPKEWKAYVEKGDLNPKKAIWNESDKNLAKMGIETKKSNYDEMFDKNGNPKGAKKRLSAKDKAHMNFIQQGKNR